MATDKFDDYAGGVYMEHHYFNFVSYFVCSYLNFLTSWWSRLNVSAVALWQQKSLMHTLVAFTRNSAKISAYVFM